MYKYTVCVFKVSVFVLYYVLFAFSIFPIMHSGKLKNDPWKMGISFRPGLMLNLGGVHQHKLFVEYFVDAKKLSWDSLIYCDATTAKFHIL